ncbi:MAG: hypothetical protein WCP96_12180 [Methylococcaceae bacterium]
MNRLGILTSSGGSVITFNYDDIENNTNHDVSNSLDTDLDLLANFSDPYNHGDEMPNAFKIQYGFNSANLPC